MFFVIEWIEALQREELFQTFLMTFFGCIVYILLDRFHGVCSFVQQKWPSG